MEFLKLLNQIKDVFKNKYAKIGYYVAIFLFAAIFPILNKEVEGVVAFLVLISFILVISDDLTDILYPVLLLAVFSTRCYNSYDTFMSIWYLAIIPLAAIIFHVVRNRKTFKIKIGPTFYGLCATSIAILLGGLGTISIKDYFSASYYVFGLSFLMLLFYFVFKCKIEEEQKQKLLFVMFLVGLFASYCVFRFYIADIKTVIETKEYIIFQSSNNLATMLMICFPFVFYFIVKNLYLIPLIPVYLLGIICTGSRGGLIFGIAEFFVLLIIFFFVVKNNKKVKIAFGSTFVIGAVIILLGLKSILKFYAIDTGSISNGELITLLLNSSNSTLNANFGITQILAENSSSDGVFSIMEFFKRITNSQESRARLLRRSFEDFLSNPIFGVGVGYRGNTDIYNPLKGAMNWYHMWIPQVYASLGVVGILTFGFQLGQRIWLTFKRQSLINWTFACGYVGLFMMSQVNPGEFCPFPYCALAVMCFVCIENGKCDKDDKALVIAGDNTNSVDNCTVDNKNDSDSAQTTVNLDFKDKFDSINDKSSLGVVVVEDNKNSSEISISTETSVDNVEKNVDSNIKDLNQQ